MTIYTVKEIFYTLQGEGRQADRAAVFCRFSGCNLWSGREEDRSKAICQFCDTDFVGTGDDGGKFAGAAALAARIAETGAELHIDPFHDLGGACFGNADCFDDFLTHIDS